MIEIHPKILKIDPGPPAGLVRLGFGCLFGVGVAPVLSLIAIGLGVPTRESLVLGANLGVWSLFLSTMAFLHADRRRGRVDVLIGAFVGAATMALFVGGRESIGHAAGGIYCMAVLGSIIGVPLGRTVRSRLARRSGHALAPAPNDLRDPWIDP